MILKSQSAAVLLLAASLSVSALNPLEKENHGQAPERNPGQNQNRGGQRPLPPDRTQNNAPLPPARIQNNTPRAGKWLQQHLNDTPQEQQRQLQNDNDFKRLTPEQQQHLQDQLKQFNTLPPQQRERIANRLRAVEALPPGKRQLLQESLRQFRQMPYDRRRMMRQAWNSLRQMPPDQQEQSLNSDRLRSSFSDEERSTLRGLLDSGFNPEENNTGPRSP
jgi:hypothetical protein